MMEYKGNIWVAILTLLVGVALIFMRSVVTTTVVVILGTLFVASGGLNTIMQFTRHDEKGKRKITFSSLITSLAAVILGIWMICDPSGNMNLVITLLGIMAILGGGYHIFSMLITYRPVKFPAWFYIMPALILGCGVFMVCSPQTFAESLVLIAGIVLIVYSIATMIEIFALMSYERDVKHGVHSSAVDLKGDMPYVEDVQARETKEIGSGQNSGHWPSDRR